MVRTLGLVVVGATVFGCGPDTGSGTKDAGNRTDSGNGGDGGGGIGTGILLSGTRCDGPVSFQLGGDERIIVGQLTSTGLLTYVGVLDGTGFDKDSEAAWQSYAQSYDVFLSLNFDTDQPATPHTITALQDSVFGGRNAGTFGFEEVAMTAEVTINAIDMTTRTIDVSFTASIFASTPSYPPVFAALTECPGTGTEVTGGFAGSFELMMY